jgi:hypothetical protein
MFAPQGLVRVRIHHEDFLIVVRREGRMKRALIVWGGLELHEPERGATLVGGWLGEAGFAVTVSSDYEVLGGADIASYDLVMPQVTGGELSGERRCCRACRGPTSSVRISAISVPEFPPRSGPTSAMPV